MSAMIDLTEKWDGTQISHGEVYLIGMALVKWIGTTVRLGHTSPGMTLDYTTGIESNNDMFVLLMRDVIAWTSGRTKLVPGSEERIRGWIAEADIDAAFAKTLDAKFRAAFLAGVSDA